jgi:hypothetical protein
MEKHSEALVAFDVAKQKHAVAIAEAGRADDVRLLGVIENSPLTIERTIKRLAERYERLYVCFEAGPQPRRTPDLLFSQDLRPLATQLEAQGFRSPGRMNLPKQC